jgi:hypothetical protein
MIPVACRALGVVGFSFSGEEGELFTKGAYFSRT